MSSVAEKLARKSNRKTPAKQVRLRLVYIDFWSAVKLSFLVAVCFAVISIVATFLIWTVLNSTDIFNQLNSLVRDIAGTGGDLSAVLSLGNVMGFAVVASLLNLVVTTALGAIIAVLYNLSVKITGGILVGFTNN
jgi:uncharacterized membrane protein